MPASNAAAEKRSQPQILVETAGLSEEEWLAYRRKGIGGSDVAALLGISPWRTARDLYYDKLNIVAVEDNEDNWVALEMGHLLEPLVAKIFQHRTRYKISCVKLSAKTKTLILSFGMAHAHRLNVQNSSDLLTNSTLYDI